MLKEKSEDGSMGDAAQHAANLAQDFMNQSWEAMDKLWSNWAALLTVVAAGSAGSWKQILEQSGRVINDLRHTEDFVKLLGDMKTAFYTLNTHLQKVCTLSPPLIRKTTILTCSQKIPADQKLEDVSKEWETQRDKLLTDLKNVYGILSKSPIWNQLMAKSKAIKAQVDKTLAETKDQVQESADKLAADKNVDKLKEDLKGILQLGMLLQSPTSTLSIT